MILGANDTRAVAYLVQAAEKWKIKTVYSWKSIRGLDGILLGWVIYIRYNLKNIYIYYIHNKVQYISSHGNVHADKAICLVAVFSVLNVVIRGSLIRGMLIKSTLIRGTLIRSRLIRGTLVRALIRGTLRDALVRGKLRDALIRGGGIKGCINKGGH